VPISVTSMSTPTNVSGQLKAQARCRRVRVSGIHSFRTGCLQTQHFFDHYKELEGKETSVHRVASPEEAKEYIQDSISRYSKEKSSPTA
jgi:inorganic pyrophosphatase